MGHALGALPGHVGRQCRARRLSAGARHVCCCRASRRASGSVCVESAAEPELLFEYLKGYLMLGDPQHLDKKHLQLLADQEWKPSAPAGAGRSSLATHFASLLEYRDALRPLPLDRSLVAQARSSIRQAVPQIMYGRLKRSYGADTAGRAAPRHRRGPRHREGVLPQERAAPLRAAPEPLHEGGLQGGHGRGDGAARDAVRGGRLGVGRADAAGQLRAPDASRSPTSTSRTTSGRGTRC